MILTWSESTEEREIGSSYLFERGFRRYYRCPAVFFASSLYSKKVVVAIFKARYPSNLYEGKGLALSINAVKL
jgi:hypothetical protein